MEEVDYIEVTSFEELPKEVIDELDELSRTKDYFSCFSKDNIELLKSSNDGFEDFLENIRDRSSDYEEVDSNYIITCYEFKTKSFLFETSGSRRIADQSIGDIDFSDMLRIKDLRKLEQKKLAKEQKNIELWTNFIKNNSIEVIVDKLKNVNFK